MFFTANGTTLSALNESPYRTGYFFTNPKHVAVVQCLGRYAFPDDSARWNVSSRQLLRRVYRVEHRAAEFPATIPHSKRPIPASSTTSCFRRKTGSTMIPKASQTGSTGLVSLLRQTTTGYIPVAGSMQTKSRRRNAVGSFH